VLALSLGEAASFGTMLPGVTRVYEASTTATVTSTMLDAHLTVADASTQRTGHLVNGSHFLPQPLQVRANTGAYGAVGSAASPRPLLSWSQPVGRTPVTLGFRQAVDAQDPLRAGLYGKTLTFTLSTTEP